MTVNFPRHCNGVIHVGANSGQERDDYARAGMSVLWVEPISEVFAELQSNIAPYPDQRAACALLSDQEGVEYVLNIANNGGASSSILDFAEHKDIWPDVAYVEQRKLRSTTLARLMDRERVTPSQYPALVMDVQGAELLVLKGLGERVREFRLIRAEAADFESYAGCCKLQDLSDYLADFGFVESGRLAFAHHPNGGTYWDVTWEPPRRSLVGRVRQSLAALRYHLLRP